MFRCHIARLTILSGVVAAVFGLAVPAAAQVTGPANGGVAAEASAPVSIKPVEGQLFTGVLGSYTENCLTSTKECPSPGTATINWGDGSPIDANATVAVVGTCNTGQTSCSFKVSGSHTYADEGTPNSPSVTWTDDSFNPPGKGTVDFTATVGDALLSITGMTVSGPFDSRSVNATLSDANPGASPGDYTATIDWGDGHTTVGLAGSGTVSAGHAYTQVGSYTVVLTVSDEGGAPPVTASQKATTPGPPMVSTGQALQVSQTGATLNGTVNPQSSTVTDCHFSWGTDTSYGHTAPCAQAPGGGTSDIPVTAALSGLSAGATYHFKLSATNTFGSTAGSDQQFTTQSLTLPGAPLVVLAMLTPAETSVAVSGTVNPQGSAVSDCHFDYGTTPSFGSSAPCSPAPGSGAANVGVSATLSGLNPGTTYYVQLVATNPGGTSRSPTATATTSPSCDTEAAFDFVDAKGCFVQGGGKFVSTPGTTVTLNGLTLVPTDSSTKITVDPASRKVSSNGEVTVSAGDVTVDQETLDWTEPDVTALSDVAIGDLKPPDGAAVKGLPLDGKLALRFNRARGADMTGNVRLPGFGGAAASGALGSLGIDTTVELHAALGTGLKSDTLKAERDDLTIGPLQIKKLSISYSPTDDIWAGSADIVLPTPNNLDIGASLAFQHGGFKSFAGSVDNLNFQIAGGVFLQRIAVVVEVNPLKLGGGVGVSLGPLVQGKTAVRIDGNFYYVFSNPGHLHVDGQLTLVSFKVASAFVDYWTDGDLHFGGELHLGLPDPSAAEPKKQPVYIEAYLNGFVNGSQSFDVEAGARVDLNFIDVTGIGVQFLASNIGISACGQIAFINAGFGYTWATHELKLMGPFSCDVGAWRSFDTAHAAAVSSIRALHLAAGGTMLRLIGVSGQPKVSLSGPGGQHVSVPLHSVAPIKGSRFVVLQDPAHGTTYIAIHSSAGTWRLSLEPGSSAIRSIQAAGLLAPPKVTAAVSGRGRNRTLSWRLKAIPGQRVIFKEVGPDVSHVLGSTSASTGRLHFTPALGRAGARKIVALISSGGLPRKAIVVTSYSAPAPGPPGRPGHLTVTAITGGGIHVSWSPATNARQYVVEVDTTDGAHLIESASGQTRSIDVTNVVTIAGATVRVVGETASGQAGPVASTAFRR